MSYCPCLRLSGFALATIVLAAVSAGADDAPRRIEPSPAALPSRRLERPTPEEIQRRWFKPLSQIRAEPQPIEGRQPQDCSEGVFGSPAAGDVARNWPCIQFQWVAPEVCFQPPYFEETPLERYGQSACPSLQPLISGVHFFAMFPLMPYKMGLDGPYQRVYTLGYYRPGSDAPCQRQRLPWDLHAALLEAGAWTSGAFALP